MLPLWLHARVFFQVPLLLKMKAGESALEKALLSGDNDLVYLALLHLRRMCVCVRACVCMFE